MKKYTQMFMMLLMASVGTNVYCPHRYERYSAADIRGFLSEIPERSHGYEHISADDISKLLPEHGFEFSERSGGWGNALALKVLNNQKSIGVGAIALVGAVIAHKTGLLEKAWNYFYPGKPMPADKDETVDKIMKQIPKDDQKESVELAKKILKK